MPKLTHVTPAYRHHKASGQAIVTLSGKDHYLGPWKSKASRVEYDRLTSQWLASGRTLPKPGLTITELAAAYWRFAKSYYIKDGEPSPFLATIKVALRAIREPYGRLPACDFGPLALQVVQQNLIDRDASLNYINKLRDTVLRAFRWAVSQQLLDRVVYDTLETTPRLKKRHTTARITPPIRPVDPATLEATLPYLPKLVADMVRVQRLTAARPSEICNIRPCDIDTSGETWCYRPAWHKTEHLDRERRIYMGHRAQEILRPYLEREPTDFCFVPAESEHSRNAEKRSTRATPMTPSQAARKPKANRSRPPGANYTDDTYRRAIHRACDKAFPAPEGLSVAEQKLWKSRHRWSPNRVRHLAATEIRKEFDIEAAQVTLGHANSTTTEIYAEKNFERAKQVMHLLG